MSAVLNLPNASLRKMTTRDLKAVLEIENRAYHYPWTEGILRDCMRVGYLCCVYEEDERVLAHGIVSIAADECHVLNLCVDPDDQDRGIGRTILRALLEVARGKKAVTVFLEVRPSNFAALALYRSEGFNEVGERKDYYPAPGGREDALILAKTL